MNIIGKILLAPVMVVLYIVGVAAQAFFSLMHLFILLIVIAVIIGLVQAVF
jgi:hypothetical protein